MSLLETKFRGVIMPFATLHDRGRVVIPKEIRRKFDMKVGDRFEVKEDNGHIVLIPKQTHHAWNWTKAWSKKVEVALRNVDEGKVSKAYDNLEDALKALKKKV